MLQSLGPSAVVAQSYHTEAQLTQHRRHLDTSVTYASPFIPLSALDAMGGAAPIRIQLLWEVMENGDLSVGGGGQGYQCINVGQDILVQSSTGAYAPSTGGFCLTKHIVTGTIGATRNAVLRSLTQRAADFFAKTLKVRPILDSNITIDSSVLNRFTMTTTTVNNADLVIIMTARPSPNRALSGFATCFQRDQYQRCTVGWFNW
jgi:hypothetical protein